MIEAAETASKKAAEEAAEKVVEAAADKAAKKPIKKAAARELYANESRVAAIAGGSGAGVEQGVNAELIAARQCIAGLEAQAVRLSSLVATKSEEVEFQQ